LRFFWTNHARVADDVWRSNHPTNGRLRQLARSGFKSIINLRGNYKLPHHGFEVQICEDSGMDLIDVPMSARTAPEVKSIMKLVSVLGQAKKPVLLHCKSGADRTGLAGAGILDHFLDSYAERLKSGPISFLNWVTEEYDPRKISASFASLHKQNGKRS
jgi:protein tyrosine phosphatase (PTP) superfamily phosphohydrolase (DUF442 family)